MTAKRGSPQLTRVIAGQGEPAPKWFTDGCMCGFHCCAVTITARRDAIADHHAWMKSQARRENPEPNTMWNPL